MQLELFRTKIEGSEVRSLVGEAQVPLILLDSIAVNHNLMIEVRHGNGQPAGQVLLYIEREDRPRRWTRSTRSTRSTLSSAPSHLTIASAECITTEASLEAARSTSPHSVETTKSLEETGVRRSASASTFLF